MDASQAVQRLDEVGCRDDLTLEQMVEEAELLLAVLVPRQTRYKVTARPDTRTIRYYTSQGLLPKPLGYAGGRARYSGIHLWRLLLIKKMQSEHHTLQQTAGVLAKMSDEEVREALLPKEAPSKNEPHIATLAAPGLTPEKAGRGDRIQRFKLASGTHVDIPEEVLKDPLRKRALMDEFEEFLDTLRGETEFTD